MSHLAHLAYTYNRLAAQRWLSPEMAQILEDRTAALIQEGILEMGEDGFLQPVTPSFTVSVS